MRIMLHALLQVIEKLKSLNPELRIHVELTSIQNRVIRKAILTEIVAKHVHSLGLDTVEVANALNVLGHEELSYSVIKKEENGIMSLYQGAVQLLKDLSLERVHVHSLGFYICILAKGHPLTLKEHRDFLLSFLQPWQLPRPSREMSETLRKQRQGWKFRFQMKELKAWKTSNFIA